MQIAQRLAGRVALVTGASRGIGRATALRLAAEGARVAINYSRDETGAAAAVREITAQGGAALAVQADVRDAASVTAMKLRIVRELGEPDILVNNAGTLAMGNALDLDSNALREGVDINLVGPMNCVREFAPLMVRRGSGRVINVSATSAFGTTARGITPHAMTKAGLLVWGKQLALELGEHGITVNAVCPGAIDTELTLPGGALHEQLAPIRAQQLRHTTLRRTGTMDEVAGVIAFLASDDAGYMTGQALSIDGGRTDFLSHSG